MILNTPTHFLTIPALARHLGLDENALRAQIERGHLPPDAFAQGGVPGTQPVPLFSADRLPEHIASLSAPEQH